MPLIPSVSCGASLLNYYRQTEESAAIMEMLLEGDMPAAREWVYRGLSHEDDPIALCERYIIATFVFILHGSPLSAKSDVSSISSCHNVVRANALTTG